MQFQTDDFIAPPCHEEIRVLFKDDHILIIDKPSGLLSLSGKHPLNKDSVHFRLVKDYPSASLVHRLDFGTSGIMVAALNKKVTAQVSKKFQDGDVVKKYIAILQGHLEPDSGIIDFPITKDTENFPLQKICYRTGKESLTRYSVIERLNSPPRTRVLFSPVSGRTHQLRIHSREIGHPILGCDLYSNDEAFFIANRLMLHAGSLEFTHPATDGKVKFVCPCPF
jgi:tRNA pseudouridine32 synthase / 23S rRNA pseudouridine746 synthase